MGLHDMLSSAPSFSLPLKARWLSRRRNAGVSSKWSLDTPSRDAGVLLPMIRRDDGVRKVFIWVCFELLRGDC